MAHGAALPKGVSVMKEIVIASGLGLGFASVWKARQPAGTAQCELCWSVRPLPLPARLARGGVGALEGRQP